MASYRSPLTRFGSSDNYRTASVKVNCSVLVIIYKSDDPAMSFTVIGNDRPIRRAFRGESLRVSLRIRLLCPEEAVARIPESGDDIGMIIEFLVKRSAEYGYIRV